MFFLNVASMQEVYTTYRAIRTVHAFQYHVFNGFNITLPSNWSWVPNANLPIDSNQGSHCKLGLRQQRSILQNRNHAD